MVHPKPSPGVPFRLPLGRVVGLLLLLIPLGSGAAAAQASTGFLDFNAYPVTGVRADNAMTINAGAALGHGIAYASLTNFGRSVSGPSADIDAWLTEQNIRWQLPHASLGMFQLTFQALMRSGESNDAARIGVRWNAGATPHLSHVLDRAGLAYWLNLHAAQFDHAPGRQWQIEHVFRWTPPVSALGERVYIAGFADHNLGLVGPRSAAWVEEAQLGVRVTGGLHVVFEQRYNGFRVGDETSFGIGIEYLLRFAGAGA